eukprot:6056656-Pyramimonas_sp.AAC.1
MLVGSGSKEIPKGPLPTPAAAVLQLCRCELRRVRVLEDPALDDLRRESILNEEGVGRPNVAAHGI